MFLALANLFGPNPVDQEKVLLVNSLQLSRWLDEVWARGGRIPPLLGAPNSPPFLGDPLAVANQRLPAGLLAARVSGIDLTNTEAFSGAAGPTTALGFPLVWHHLIYAYLVEATGIHEVFAEVVRRLVVGESLGTLRADSVQWLRTTEDLFFKDPPLFAINGVVSEVRRHARINRRNAYWRMFGMDLPHQVPSRWGPTDDTSWKSDIGAGVNADFRAKWTELLRQVWLGIENLLNTSGTNPTDPTFLVLLCDALRDMLHDRRKGGQLAREEFAYVTMMSWFHLTVAQNTPIVLDLQAAASNSADRLAAIAQRVGMNSAARSRELFQLAQPMSRILRGIELNLFGAPAAASQLFRNPGLRNDMTALIDNWQSATGERVKERPVGTALAAQPLRIPAPAAVPAVRGLNGTRTT